METRVVTKYLRIAPRKVRLVLSAIKGKPAVQAMAHLRVMNQKGARLSEKVLRSAIASAKEKKMDEGKLFIKEVRADGGPIFKRIMTRSMGRADRIAKRTTHITMVLGEREMKQVRPLESGKESGEPKKKFLGLARRKKEQKAAAAKS